MSSPAAEVCLPLSEVDVARLRLHPRPAACPVPPMPSRHGGLIQAEGVAVIDTRDPNGAGAQWRHPTDRVGARAPPRPVCSRSGSNGR